MLDVLPKLLIELREDAAVDAIANGRVRGAEPGPGDAQPVGKYKAFVVLSTLATPRFPTLPVQRARVNVRCYGRTFTEAAALYGACSDAIHFRGSRVHNNGLGIYRSHDDTGGSEDRDPDTQQPVYSFVIDALATTQPVGVGS